MIGFFDSGVGGFSVLRALRERAPHADVLYFADTKNAPYGNRSHEELMKLTMDDIEILINHGARQIVSACNSVSQSIAQLARDRFHKDFDFIEMTIPTIESFRGNTSSVLVVGTKATIGSNLYQSGFESLGITAHGLVIPDLAYAVEQGKNEEEIDALIREAFSGIDVQAYTTVLLACTHFPLIMQNFKKVLPGTALLVDPAVSVAGEIAKRFHVDGNGSTRFLLSQDSDVFRKYAAEFVFREAPVEILLS